MKTVRLRYFQNGQLHEVPYSVMEIPRMGDVVRLEDGYMREVDIVIWEHDGTPTIGLKSGAK